MINRIVLLFVALFIFCSSSKSQKIVQAGKEYNFVHYSIDEGLAHNEVFKVYETSKGFIWACTAKGVSRFDGINFKNFTEKDGLPSSVVMSACEDANGNMWFGTIKGLALLKNNKIITFDSAFKFPLRAIRSITNFNDGTLWLCENNHLIHINPTNLTNPTIKVYTLSLKVDNIMFRDIWKNKKGELVVGCEHGCFRLKNDSLVRYNNMTTPAYQMVELPNGVEWFNAWNQPLKTFKNGVSTGEIDFGSGTLGMTKDKQGNIWVVTWERGIYKFDGEKFINFSTKEGMPFNTFWGINEDSKGNMWFSSWGSGIFKYSNDCFTKISEKSGLPSNNIASVAQGKDGKIWIATDLSVSSYDPIAGKLENITECKGEKLSQVVKLFIHPNGQEIWCMGYLGKGYKIINNKIIEIDSLAGHDVDMDNEGNLYIGSDDRGLIKISEGKTTNFDTKTIYGFSRVAKLYRDKNQNLWMINHLRGLSVFCNNQIQHFNKKNGFYDDGATAIVQDTEGFYWVAVNKKGVFKFDFLPDNKLKLLDSLTINDNPALEDINSLIIHDKNLYMGCATSMLSCEMKSFGSAIKIIRVYGKEHGLVGANCKLNLVDKQGKIWVTTDKGLYCFDPALSKLNITPTKTHILDIKLFYETPDWSLYSKGIAENNLPSDLVLPYKKNHLTFSFVGINFIASTKVLYQYKLEGLDKDWSPPTDKTEADYSSIPPGTYTFMVKSCNNDGLWNDASQNFVFTIKPPFWNTLWFYSLCIIVVVILVFFFIKSREKKLKKEKVILENKVTQRTSELKEAFLQIEEKNKEITDSINYASKIQVALLPAHTDIQQLTEEFFILFKPKDIVSGDFYWSDKKGELFYLAVCDSTGHGVPGAFMSLLNLNFINEAVNEKNIVKPNEIFNYVRQELVTHISKEGQSDGFDGTLMCFDKAKKTFSYAAANTKPILVRKGEVILLASDKMPVGKGEKNNSFALNEMHYQTDDILYLFSDGYPDQFGGPNGKKLKYKKFEEMILMTHTLPMNQQAAILEKKFNEWKGDLGQVDDVCVIGIKL